MLLFLLKRDHGSRHLTLYKNQSKKTRNKNYVKSENVATKAYLTLI